jgi:hypothetical protein
MISTFSSWESVVVVFFSVVSGSLVVKAKGCRSIQPVLDRYVGEGLKIAVGAELKTSLQLAEYRHARAESVPPSSGLYQSFLNERPIVKSGSQVIGVEKLAYIPLSYNISRL